MNFVCAVNTYVSGTVKLLPTSPTIKTEVSKYHDRFLIKSGRCLTIPDSQYLYHINVKEPQEIGSSYALYLGLL